MPDYRKSGRSKKSVDYSKFSVGDDGDDDDFRDSTPPPSKKSKVTDQPPKKSKVTEVTKVTQPPKRAKDKIDKNCDKLDSENKKMGNKNEGRLPVSERKFAKDLRAAIDLSRQSSQPSTVESEPEDGKMADMVKGVEKSHVQSDEERTESLEERECKVGMDDNPEESESESDDHDDSDASGSDSDYESTKTKVKTKPGPKCSKVTKSVPRSKTPAIKVSEKKALTPTPAPSSPEGNAPLKSVSSNTPSLKRTPLGTSTNRMPSWTPPARVNTPSNRPVDAKSPGSGLRLGLSRSQRVKPLHSNANGQ